MFKTGGDRSYWSVGRSVGIVDGRKAHWHQRYDVLVHDGRLHADGVQRPVKLIVAVVRPGVPAPCLQGHKVAVPAVLQQLGQVSQVQVGQGRGGGEDARRSLPRFPRGDGARDFEETAGRRPRRYFVDRYATE